MAVRSQTSDVRGQKSEGQAPGLTSDLRPLTSDPCPLNRRSFFHQVAGGIYGTALTFLLGRDLYAGSRSPDQDAVRLAFDLKPRPPHFTPKARSVIHLFMNGGPSQMDLFDPKPMLDKHNGEAYFDKVAADLTGPENAGGLLRSPFKFAQHGKSGMWISDLMPHLAEQADRLCVIRS